MKIKIIELLKYTKRNFVNFISILIFVFLGVTLFEGLEFTGRATRLSINKTLVDSNTYDLKIRFGALLSQNDVDDFKDIDCIDDSEGSFTAFDDFTIDGSTYSCAVFSLTSKITKVIPFEGSLPKKDNEIAVLKTTAKELGISIGDQITFERENIEGFLQVASRDFLTIDPNALTEDSIRNFKYKTFKVTGIVRYGDILNRELTSYPIDFKTGNNVKAAFFTNYSAFNPFITGNRFNTVNLRNYSLDGNVFFSEKYTNGTEETLKKVKQFVETKNYSINFTQINEDYPEIYEIFKDYLYEYEFITQEQYINDQGLKDTFNGAVNALTKLESVRQYTKRNEILGSIISGIMSDIFVNEKTAIGGVFFVISILICYSAITRLVNNDSKIIGTKKSLGFTTFEISRFYLSFTLIATCLAIVLGNLAAFGMENLIIPIIFKLGYGILYYTSYFDWALASIVAIISLILISGITLFGINSIVKRKAIELLQGNNELTNKIKNPNRKSNFFNKIPLFYKSIFRNFRHDFKRIFATTIGIASSVALIMASFSLKFVVQESFTKQYHDYFSFDTIVYKDAEIEDASSNLETFFNDRNIEFTPVYRDYMFFTVDGNEPLIGYLYVYFDNATFNNLVTLDHSSNNPTFNNKGFWLPESYQKEYKCPNKSSLKLTSLKGNSIEASSTGFFKYYSYQGTIFVDAETYNSYLGEPIAPNSYLINRKKIDIKTFEKDIKNVSGYSFSYDSYGKFNDEVQVFYLVCNVLFSLYAAATLLLSIFVILNLFITYIKEKKREIITLMINGYSIGQASRYIYLDTIFLTIFSLILGSGFGILLGLFGQVSIESKYLYFIHGPNITSLILGNLITLALVILMTLISFREIKKLKLKDINEA